MIKNIDVLAKFVKGGAEVLQKALTEKDEIELELIEGDFVSHEQLETLKSTVRDEGKKEGQTIGYDFAMKDIKKDFGIDVEGKDRKVIAENIRAKIMADAKIEPDKKVNELKQSLEALQKTYQTDIETKTNELERYKQTVQQFKIDSELTNHLPQGLSGIKPQHFLVIAKTEYGFDYDNGELVVKKGDQVMKDRMEKPLKPSEVLLELARQSGFIGQPGRGGEPGGQPAGDFKSINDVYAHMEKNKINPMSDEGQKLIADFKNLKQ